MQRFGLICLLVLTINPASMCPADEKFADRIADLWLRGEKTRVLQLAEDRLARNPDDIVGLLLKREYQSAFSLVPDVYATMDRIEVVAPRIASPHFSALRSLLMADIEISRKVFSRLSGEQLEAERPKGAIPNKPLPCARLIEALEADGYVSAAALPPDLLGAPSP